MIIFALLIPTRHIQAEPAAGVSVSVSIESFDRNLARGVVNAPTFDEAIKTLAKDTKLQLTYIQEGNKTRVQSVGNATEKTFGTDDGWFGYVLREGGIVRPDDYMALPLQEDDQVVLYYGDRMNTKVVSYFESIENTDKVTFLLQTEQTNWVMQNQAWVEEKLISPLPQVKIRVALPSGNQKVLQTNEHGLATTSFQKLGAYQYFAEGYRGNTYPSTVRTANFTMIYGVANQEVVTRGEALAFIVNSFPLKRDGKSTDTINTTSPTDVDGKTPYGAEILLGLAAGLATGYEDGTFRPNEPVTLLEMVVMLGNSLPEPDTQVDAVTNVPLWANDAVSKAVSKGWLNGLAIDWNSTMTTGHLLQIYQNK